MCGRYVLDATPAQLAATFRAIDRLGVLQRTFNAAPGQLLPVVLPTADGGRVMERALWGLVPPEGVKAPPMLVNARAEVLGRAPAHRAAFYEGRCVVPATGFYEWAPPSPEEAPRDHEDDPDAPSRLFDPGPADVAPQPARMARGPKVPMLFRVGEGELFALAGLSRDVVDEHGEARRTFAVVTTRPNELVSPIHDRMPAILAPDAVEAWLSDDQREARAAISSFPAELMETYAVERLVNDVANDGPELVRPAT